jgi:hypothetical protein
VKTFCEVSVLWLASFRTGFCFTCVYVTGRRTWRVSVCVLTGYEDAAHEQLCVPAGRNPQTGMQITVHRQHRVMLHVVCRRFSRSTVVAQTDVHKLTFTNGERSHSNDDDVLGVSG